MDLLSKKCVPCEGGIPRFDKERIAMWMPGLSGWEERGDKLYKTFTFPNFVEAMAFLNKVAAVAEGEGHHPDFCVHYNRVEFTIWTHAVGGLSENDFILAAKLDALT